jgi:putative transposase
VAKSFLNSVPKNTATEHRGYSLPPCSAVAASLCRGAKQYRHKNAFGRFRVELQLNSSAELLMLKESAREYPRRPPRLEWLFANMHPFYFVTFNTYKRNSLLARSEIHETFRSFCTRAEAYNVAVGRYVIMPNHIHLFVVLPPESMTLQKWIQALRTVLGKNLLALGHPKPHWQEGFFDHVLRSSESYSQKWDYVRLNPVRAGLSETPES